MIIFFLRSLSVCSGISMCRKWFVLSVIMFFILFMLLRNMKGWVRIFSLGCLLCVIIGFWVLLIFVNCFYIWSGWRCLIMIWVLLCMIFIVI